MIGFLEKAGRARDDVDAVRAGIECGGLQKFHRVQPRAARAFDAADLRARKGSQSASRESDGGDFETSRA
jgi:hypothetical protein